MDYEYKIIRSNRKTIELSITKELEIVVRAPYKMSSDYINYFVNKNDAWIEKHMEIVKNRTEKPSNKELTPKEIDLLKKEAKLIISKKVDNFKEVMGVNPTSIKITSAKTRWGSCSYKNGLCFSYRLMLMPDDFIDYVVVHELAHIKIKNHSKLFYQEVEKYIPNYKFIISKNK